MKNLRFFRWAMMHHPDFKLCYIQMPIVFRAERSYSLYQTYFRFDITIRPVSIFVPYSVRDAYWTAQGKAEQFFDDIPF